MRVKISGAAQPCVSTKILSGIGSKFLSELHLKDRITIASGTYTVEAIASDTKAILNLPINLVENTEIFLIEVNPHFILSNIQPVTERNWYGFSQLLSSLTVSSNIVTGGQVQSRLSMSSLSYETKHSITTLPYGYDYYTPYDNLTICQTTMGSNTLTIPKLELFVTIIKNNNYIEIIDSYQNNTIINYLITGSEIKLGSSIYKVISKIKSNYNGSASIKITFDKPFSYTLSKARLEIPDNYDKLYPVGCIIQLNGKMYTVENSTPSSVQLKYPISDTAVVTIRRPLIGTLIGINSIVFSNIDFDQTILAKGNIVYVQELRDENSLYDDAIAYGELKVIDRNFGTHVVTSEINKRQFYGVVHFGKLNNGFYKFVDGSMAATNLFNFNSSWYPSIGEVIKLDETLHTVTNTYYFYGFAQLTIDPPKPLGSYSMYRVISINQTSYSPLIKGLCLKLIEQEISKARFSRMSLEAIQKLFLYTENYALNLFAKEHTIYTQTQPMLWSTNRYIAPPTPFTKDFSVIEYSSNRLYSMTENRLIRRCGHYIRTPK